MRFRRGFSQGRRGAGVTVGAVSLRDCILMAPEVEPLRTTERARRPAPYATSPVKAQKASSA